VAHVRGFGEPKDVPCDLDRETEQAHTDIGSERQERAQLQGDTNDTADDDADAEEDGPLQQVAPRSGRPGPRLEVRPNHKADEGCRDRIAAGCIQAESQNTAEGGKHGRNTNELSSHVSSWRLDNVDNVKERALRVYPTHGGS